MTLRRRVIESGLAVVSATRADRWLAPLARGRGVILTFHRVRPDDGAGFAPNRVLAITPDFLEATLEEVRAAGFEIVPLDAVPARLAQGDGPPFAALTFDDGYRDNVEHALPVLRRHGAPFTLYVAADFAAGTGRLWWVELEGAIAALHQVRFEGSLLPAGSDSEKTSAFNHIYVSLRSGSEDRLRAGAALLADQAGLDPAALVREACLTWGELVTLSRDPLVTIGAHTLSHPRLARLGEREARREIAGSRQAIEERLGLVPRHFSYPLGGAGEAGVREFTMARQAGFATAVTTRPGHLFPEHAAHLHALPRVSVNGLHQTRGALRALLSGVPFLAWNRGRRLNVA